jgi:beta-mannosidase
VPRDASAGWDFEDVRDHYLRLLYKTDPVSLRYADHPRYLELSRHTTGEVMAEVFGEWRRAASPCGGGLVLWMTDLAPGAGWGILDHRGHPKVACHYLRRAWAPITVWSTDEGLRGLVVHVANDTPASVEATLRIALYQDFLTPVEALEHPVVLAPHSGLSANAEGLLGHFVDITWAYRFGPPAQDLVVMTLERAGGQDAGRVLAQAFHFPAGRPTRQEPAATLGLSGSAVMLDADHAELTVSSHRFAYGVRVDVPGFVPADDAFSVEPGGRRVVDLRRAGDDVVAPSGHLTALTLRGRVAVKVDDRPG